MSYSIIIVNVVEKNNTFLLHYLERGMLQSLNELYLKSITDRLMKYNYVKAQTDGEYTDYIRKISDKEIKAYVHRTHVIFATEATDKESIFELLQDASELSDSDGVAIYNITDGKWGVG